MSAMSDAVLVSLITTAGLVIVAVVGYLGLRLTNREVRTVKAEVADVHNTAKDIKKDTHAIDGAVNNAELGMPTLAQRVIDSDQRDLSMAEELAATREWQATVLGLITEKFGITIPPAPASVDALSIQLPTGVTERTQPRLTNVEAIANQEPPV